MRKVVVVSSDAMVGEDLEIYSNMPSYKKLFEGGAGLPGSGIVISSIVPISLKRRKRRDFQQLPSYGRLLHSILQ